MNPAEQKTPTQELNYHFFVLSSLVFPLDQLGLNAVIGELTQVIDQLYQSFDLTIPPIQEKFLIDLRRKLYQEFAVALELSPKQKQDFIEVFGKVKYWFLPNVRDLRGFLISHGLKDFDLISRVALYKYLRRIPMTDEDHGALELYGKLRSDFHVEWHRDRSFEFSLPFKLALSTTVASCILPFGVELTQSDFTAQLRSGDGNELTIPLAFVYHYTNPGEFMEVREDVRKLLHFFEAFDL